MSGADRTATLAELGLSGPGGAGAALSDEAAATRVTGLGADSREIRPGHLFAALPGARAHGARFVAQALKAGAAAVLTDAEGADIAGPLQVPLIVVPDPRRALALAAAAWFEGQPGTVVAVTGTNGKTSVASFTRQIWSLLRHSAVAFGTTGIEGAAPREGLAAMTTPDPVSLHRLLAELAEEGVSHVAMEASSHGLDQRRLDGVRLAAAAFTNITRDHLDYHGSFDAYMAAKLSLFDRVLPLGGRAVVNCDDPAAALVRLVAIGRGQEILGVGSGPGADLRLLDAVHAPAHLDIQYSHAGQTFISRLSLIGDFQAANVLMAAGLAIATGAVPERVFALLPHLKGVRGRMELAGRRENGAAVYVDYAHTPDALRSALRALRPHVEGRLACVFGAGGERDPGKRPMMGAAVAEAADLAIVTDDNPRSEDPGAIRAAILPACPGAREIGDRAEAILTAIEGLGPEDALLIAGKGHETGQVVAGNTLPFDDAEVARAAIAALDGADEGEAG